MHGKVDSLCLLLWFTISFLPNVCLCLFWQTYYSRWETVELYMTTTQWCPWSFALHLLSMMPERAPIFRPAPSTQRFSRGGRSLGGSSQREVVFQFSELNICIKRSQSGRNQIWTETWVFAEHQEQLATPPPPPPSLLLLQGHMVCNNHNITVNVVAERETWRIMPEHCNECVDYPSL